MEQDLMLRSCITKIGSALRKNKPKSLGRAYLVGKLQECSLSRCRCGV
jgi:hypothetical protein